MEPSPPSKARAVFHVVKSYAVVSLVFIVAVEIAIGVSFLQQRSIHDRDRADGCRDECLNTWLGMVFIGVLLFVWPIVSIVVAVFLRIIYRAGLNAWAHVRERKVR
jgi:phosphate/sulfate permease